MVPMPLSPAQTLSHTSSTFSPSDVMTPRPVITTRRLPMRFRQRGRECGPPQGFAAASRWSLARVLFDVVDRLPDRLDLLRLFVRDGQLEFVLELHHQFYGVQRVGVQVIDEVGFAGDLALV